MGRTAREILAIAEHLGERRYPVILITERIARGELLAVAENVDALYLDYNEDVMSSEDGPIPGAYQWWQLCDWLREKARESGNLIINNVDDMIASWDDKDKSAFYREFLKTESESVVILVSHIGKDFQSSSNERGKGVVWNGVS